MDKYKVTFTAYGQEVKNGKVLKYKRAGQFTSNDNRVIKNAHKLALDMAKKQDKDIIGVMDIQIHQNASDYMRSIGVDVVNI